MPVLHSRLEGKEFTFADVIINEGFSTSSADEVDITSQFTKNIKGSIPLISAPMDTVTECEMAIAVANQGGLPIIHSNFPSDKDSTGIEKQTDEIRRTKRWRSGFIEKPITLSPDAPIEEADAMMKKYKIGSIIVTDDGKPHGELKGFITKYDYSLEPFFGTGSGMHAGLCVSDRMRPFERVYYITTDDIKGEDKLQVAYRKLLESHRGMIPILDKDKKVVYIVSRKDVEKSVQFPNSLKDKKGRLVVFASIGTRAEDKKRIESLVDADADGVCIETSHAYKQYVFDMLKFVKNTYPQLDVIIGNTTNPEAVKRFIELGADAVKIGIGPGSTCVTRSDFGIGRPQLSAIYYARLAAEKMKDKYGKVPIIGDGGFTSPGSILKGLALGADSIMSGNMFAGTEEAPGDYLYTSTGVRVKQYRGMGSRESMNVTQGEARGDRSLVVPEGVSGYVEDRGPVSKWIPYMMEGLRKAMEKAGASNIQELYQKAEVLPHSMGAQQEGVPHNLVSYTKSK